MTVKIKICGVTTPEAAAMVAGSGANYLGINFWPRSPRHVSGLRAEQIVEAARSVNEDLEIVGVFVNQSDIEIEHLVDDLELDFVQFHGDESAALVEAYGVHAIKAVPIATADDLRRAVDYPCSKILFDSKSSGYGGSGQAFSWDIAGDVSGSGKEVFLAGGLNPSNVVTAIRMVRPYAVDVASGVESRPGVKDSELVARFISNVRTAGE
jgi:phosphoribosylanthranilate isomerase